MHESLSEIDRKARSIYLLRDLIEKRLGLALTSHNGLRSLPNRLADRLEQTGCKSFLDYNNLLMKGDAAAENEWRHVMVALATPKSGFWRHRDAVRVLVEVVLPQLMASSRVETLRIWSTSCSSGEEPVSIAMALNEAGWFDRASIEINASDASYAAIDLAMQGVYSDKRVRGIDTRLRKKYFTQQQDGWRIAPDLHRLIRWKVANLMNETEVADLSQSHVIFCQNVFIYFTEQAIRKTLALFARSMPARAYLFSDSGEYFTGLVSSTNLFDKVETGRSVLWIKGTGDKSMA